MKGKKINYTKLKEALSSLTSFFLEEKNIRWAVVIFLFVSICLIVCINFTQDFSLKLNMKSPVDIRSPRNAFYIDELETKKLQEKLEEEVEPVYEYDGSVPYQVQELVKDIFEKSKKIVKGKGKKEEKITKLKDFLTIKISYNNLKCISESDETTLSQLEETALNIISKIMEEKIREDTMDLNFAKEKINREIEKLPLTEKYKSLLKEILKKCVRSNTFLNRKETEKRKREVRRKIKPVTKPIFMGEIILKKGDIVKKEDLKKLEAAGVISPKINWELFLGVGIINLILIFIISIYLKKYQKKIYSENKFLFLISLLTIFTLFLGKIIKNFLSGYLTIIPFTSSAIILAILLNPPISMLISGGLSILLGIMMNNEIKFLVLSIISSWVGILGVSNLSQRQDIAKTGGMVSIINIVGIAGFGFILGENHLQTLLNSSLGIINGISVVILSIGGLYFFERLFDIVTPLKLLELSNPNEPLLRKLMIETPGTYNHSITVGNLAEAAAREIGADAFLVRVGAYYHDIGKIKRPYFFVENQINIENLHEKISPSLSALIIKSHVSDGIEMAKQYNLPQCIIDFIAEHHGTGLISYFYQKMKDTEKDTSSEKKDYRYDGPKPQTKETAIVLLADSIEAAIRALENPTPEQISTTVEKIIKSKIEDKQLDECELNFKELEIIKKSFLNLLEGMFHPRIEYPEEIEIKGSEVEKQ
jgi:putative nucleotidyltransferase with HDIG domain